VHIDHNDLASQNHAALVTTANSQPALRTGLAMLGLVSLLDLQGPTGPTDWWRWAARRPPGGFWCAAAGADRHAGA
jgi:hypothetical protein